MEARYGAGYNGCMKYSTGTRFNFSVAAGLAEVMRLEVGKAGSLDGLSVSGAVFRFAYEVEGVVHNVPVEHGEVAGALVLRVPALEAGVYRYALEFADDVGDIGVLLHGDVTAISQSMADELVAGAEEAKQRVLCVEAGSLHSGPLELRWQASSVAGVYAEAARDALERVEDAVKSIEGMDKNMLQMLEAVQVFMRSFNDALREAISVVNNYLYVGGVNTGHYLKGEPGVTPHIGLDGLWYAGTTQLSDRPAFGEDGITPHITPDGFWAFGDFKTQTRAEGRDGLDGGAVRRIKVARYEDIPTSGETCNGGFLYYVPCGEETVTRQMTSVPSGTSVDSYTSLGVYVFSASRNWTLRGGVLKKMGLQSSNDLNGEPSAEALYAHVYYEETGAWWYAGRSLAAVAQAANEVSWWEFGEMSSVPDGCRVKVVFSQVASEPAESEIEQLRVKCMSVSAADGSKIVNSNFCAQAWWQSETQGSLAYDIYAWVEDGDSAGWARVDMKYDIATSRTYGLGKLATDSLVAGGAPVGMNAEGQFSVPVADAAMPGALLPSSSSTTSSGGLTHVGSDKKLYVGMATPSVPGVGKTSYTQTVDNTNSVGMTEDGKYAVPRARAFQWGVSKVGTSVPQSNGMPYILPIGQAEDGVLNEYGQDITGQLMLNVLNGGALRTYTKEGWASVAPNGIDTALIFEGSNAFGLVTSVQFNQSAAVGLELRAATTELLAGVYLARDKDDDRAAAVVTAATLRESDKAVRDWVEENYYTKEQVPTKGELSDTLTRYVTKSTADATYASKAQLNNLSADVVHKDDPYIPGYIMTEEEYNALGSNVEPNLVYFQV